jgi:hypothetical protein
VLAATGITPVVVAEIEAEEEEVAVAATPRTQPYVSPLLHLIWTVETFDTRTSEFARRIRITSTATETAEVVSRTVADQCLAALTPSRSTQRCSGLSFST